MDNFASVSCVTTVIIVLTIVGIVLRHRRKRHFYEKASKFSGPPTLPIIGNAHLFTGSYEDIMNRLIQLGKSHRTPCRFWIGNYLLLMINTPEQFKVVLHSPKTIDKDSFLGFARPWIGTGLLTAPGKWGSRRQGYAIIFYFTMYNMSTIIKCHYQGVKWRVHRKLIQPTFSTTILQSFVRIFSAQSMTIVKEMERHLDGPEFDVIEYTTQWAVHTTCATTMGVNLRAQKNGTANYGEMAEKVIASFCRRAASPWLHPDFMFNHSQLGKDQQKGIKFLHAFTDNVIQRKKAELLEQSHRPGLAENNKEDTGDSNPKRKVFLDHLIEISHDGGMLSDEEFREEVQTIMGAGTDTIAVTSSYVMLMLVSHPEVQERVHQELDEIYGDDDGEELHVTPEELTSMTYLDRVIKETLRLFPIVPFIGRSVTEDLDIGEHTLPAESLVILSIIGIHRNGDIWPDPFKFDPDRFLPEEVKKRDSYTYLPFSGGPRNCIGSKYATMSIKTFIATILRRYVLKKDKVVPTEDLRFRWEFIMRPVDPITIKIERRSRTVPSI